MSNEEEICRKFLKHPQLNPETGARLIFEIGAYNKYSKMCEKYNHIPDTSPSKLLTSDDVFPSKKSPSISKICGCINV